MSLLGTYTPQECFPWGHTLPRCASSENIHSQGLSLLGTYTPNVCLFWGHAFPGCVSPGGIHSRSESLLGTYTSGILGSAFRISDSGNPRSPASAIQGFQKEELEKSLPGTYTPKVCVAKSDSELRSGYFFHVILFGSASYYFGLGLYYFGPESYYLGPG